MDYFTTLPHVLFLYIIQYLPFESCYSLRILSTESRKILKSTLAQHFVHIGFVPIDLVPHSSIDCQFSFLTNEKQLSLQVSQERVYFKGKRDIRQKIQNQLKQSESKEFQRIAKNMSCVQDLNDFDCFSFSHIVRFDPNKTTKENVVLELISNKKTQFIQIKNQKLFIPLKYIAVNEHYIFVGFKKKDFYPIDPFIWIYQLSSTQSKIWKLSDYIEDSGNCSIIHIVALETRFVIVWLHLHLTYIGIVTISNEFEFTSFKHHVLGGLFCLSLRYLYPYRFSVNEHSFALFVFDEIDQCEVIKIFSLSNGSPLFTAIIKTCQPSLSAATIHIALTSSFLYIFRYESEKNFASLLCSKLYLS